MDPASFCLIGLPYSVGVSSNTPQVEGISSRVESKVQVRNNPSMVRGSLSDASAVSVHRYGLTELSSGVTGEDDVPLVKYAPQSQDGVDLSDLVSIIVVHGLWGHPKRTWEADAAPTSVASSDVSSPANIQGPRKNSFVEIMKNVGLKRQQTNRTYTPSIEDSTDTSSSLELYRTTQSQGKTDRTPGPKKCFWPRDLLPLDLPEARILTYGYDADVLGPTQGGDTNLQNFTKHGQDLLVHLEREIPDKESHTQFCRLHAEDLMLIVPRFPSSFVLIVSVEL